jgi:cobalt/nickel transport system ATP-binding protein
MASIATLLSMTPDIILFDEPSIALDPRNRRTLIQVINKLRLTKLIASHDLDLVLETCTRVILIAEGKIIKDGPAEEILRDKELLEANHLELPLCLQRR